MVPREYKLQLYHQLEIFNANAFVLQYICTKIYVGEKHQFLRFNSIPISHSLLAIFKCCYGSFNFLFIDNLRYPHESSNVNLETVQQHLLIGVLRLCYRLLLLKQFN